MNLGQGIIHVRIAKNLSQGELSEASGISQTYLSLIETNEKFPSIKTLHKIAKAMGGVPIPVIFWFSMDHEDHGRYELTKLFKKTIDSLIHSIYL